MSSKKVSNVLTKEETLLFEDFNKNMFLSSALLFGLNAVMVSVVPIWLFWKIHMMNILNVIPVLFTVSCSAVCLMMIAYKNNMYTLKHYIILKRHRAVRCQLYQEVSSQNKNMKKRKRECDFLMMWNNIAEFEAATFSIFYNNTLFYVLVIFISCYLLYSLPPTFNYALTLVSSSALLAFWSLF